MYGLGGCHFVVEFFALHIFMTLPPDLLKNLLWLSPTSFWGTLDLNFIAQFRLDIMIIGLDEVMYINF